MCKMEDYSKVVFGNNVTLDRNEDNPDIEDIVTNNLMMSYEQRMKSNM